MNKIFTILGLIFFMYGCSPVFEEVELTFELKQLKLNSSTESHASGAFFVFMGGFSSSSKQVVHYYFYTKDDKGIIKLRKQPRSKICFVEDIKKDQTPYATTITSRHIQSKVVNPPYWNPWILHIPENSIFQSYDIGLNNIK